MSGYDFHIIRSVGVKSDSVITVQFDNGVFMEYDLSVIADSYPHFRELLKKKELLRRVRVDECGTGIIWNDEIDLDSCEIWNNGKEIKSPFKNMISFADASSMWSLEGSTLRRAVSYGKLIPGRDCAKFGKQWVVTSDAMIREYGELRNKDNREQENKWESLESVADEHGSEDDKRH